MFVFVYMKTWRGLSLVGFAFISLWHVAWYTGLRFDSSSLILFVFSLQFFVSACIFVFVCNLLFVAVIGDLNSPVYRAVPWKVAIETLDHSLVSSPWVALDCVRSENDGRSTRDVPQAMVLLVIRNGDFSGRRICARCQRFGELVQAALFAMCLKAPFRAGSSGHSISS